MTTEELSVLPPRNRLVGNQVTLLYGTFTATETESPETAVLASAVAPLTWTVVCTPEKPAPLRALVTAVVTSEVALPFRTPTRAPLRAALLIISSTIIARPNSTMPRMRRNNRE